MIIFNKKSRLNAPRIELLLTAIVLLGAFIICISSVLAWSSNIFNNSLTNENLTFSGSQNIIRWLSIPNSVSVITKGYLNLSGYISSYYAQPSAYYKFNENGIENAIDSSGNNLTLINSGEGTHITGKLNKATNFSESYTTYTHSGSTNYIFGLNNFTIAYWFNSSAADMNVPYMGVYNPCAGGGGWYVAPNGGVYWEQSLLVSDGLRLTTPGILTEDGNWHRIIFTREGLGLNQARAYVDGVNVYNGTIADDINKTNCNFMIGMRDVTGKTFSLDDVGIWNNFAFNQTLVNEDWNSGTGQEQSSLSGKIIQQSYTNNPYLLINNTNVWNYTGTFNQLNNRTINLSSIINQYLTSSFLVGSNYLIPFAFHSNTIGILKYLDMDFETSAGMLENSQTYNATTYFSSNEGFIINLSYDTSVYNSISGKLYYNNISFSGTVFSSTGKDVLISRNINIPVLNQSSASFVWQIDLSNSTGIYYFNSTTKSQNINTFQFGLCNSSLNVSFANFTVRSAEYPFKQLNATFKSTWNLGLGSVTMNNVSVQDLTEKNSTFNFCFDPTDKKYIADTIISYDAVGYSPNYYYLSGASLTNSTQFITLYLLNDSKATMTQLQTIDNAQNPLTGIIIQIQAYDAGTNTYNLVSVAKTDYSGQDIAYLNWYDTLYKFIFIQNGQVVKTTTAGKISSTPQRFFIQATPLFPFDKFRDFQYSLTYNNDTQNFVLTFVKPSGLVDMGCLRVVNRAGTNGSDVCFVCDTAASATLYCNIASAGNGTFVAVFYATGSLDIIDWISETIGGSFAKDIYNLLGKDDATAYAFLFGGIVVSMFFITPVLGIIGMLLGILGATALGFSTFDYGTYSIIVVIGGIIIWLLKR